MNDEARAHPLLVDIPERSRPARDCAPVSVIVPCYRCTATIDDAIASVVALHELMHSVETIYSRTFETMPLLIVAALWYLIMVSLLSVGQYFIERHYLKGWQEVHAPLQA